MLCPDSACNCQNELEISAVSSISLWMRHSISYRLICNAPIPATPVLFFQFSSAQTQSNFSGRRFSLDSRFECITPAPSSICLETPGAHSGDVFGPWAVVESLYFSLHFGFFVEIRM